MQSCQVLCHERKQQHNAKMTPAELAKCSEVAGDIQHVSGAPEPVVQIFTKDAICIAAAGMVLGLAEGWYCDTTTENVVCMLMHHWT
jgi:hypothetical protein